MKKLLFILLAFAGITMFSCSGGDDDPTTPPSPPSGAIDKTKLFGEWKQMPEQYSDGRYNDEDYYASLVINSDYTFTGKWSEGESKDQEGVFEYCDVEGYIQFRGDKVTLYERFYGEDDDDSEDEVREGLEIVTLTDDILVLREPKTEHNSNLVYGYMYYGFYREGAAAKLPTLGYESNVSNAEMKIYDSAGSLLTNTFTCSYSEQKQTLKVRIFVTMLDGTVHEYTDVYVSAGGELESYDKFVYPTGGTNQVNLDIQQNFFPDSRSNEITIYTSGIAGGQFYPEKTITVVQNGMPSSGGSTGGGTGGGTGGSTGGTTESEWVRVNDSPGKMPYWYCPTDGETIPANPPSKNYTTYKNTRTGAYKIEYAYDEYTVKKGYNKITINTEAHSVYDSKYGFWKSCIDKCYIECTVY